MEKKLITAHLFKTEITEVLFDTVRGKYGVNTKAGREVRRILKKIVELGKNSPEFEDEDLPDITFVEDEEEEPALKKPKSFRGLFGKKTKDANKRASVVMAQGGEKPSDISDMITILSSNPVLTSTALPAQLASLLDSIPTTVSNFTLNSTTNKTVTMTHITDKNTSKIRDLSKKRKRVNINLTKNTTTFLTNTDTVATAR